MKENFAINSEQDNKISCISIILIDSEEFWRSRNNFKVLKRISPTKTFIKVDKIEGYKSMRGRRPAGRYYQQGILGRVAQWDSNFSGWEGLKLDSHLSPWPGLATQHCFEATSDLRVKLVNVQ